MIKYFRFMIVCLQFFVVSTHAEVAVIVHSSNKVKLLKNDIRNIYLGKVKTFPNGIECIPLFFSGESPVNQEFYKKVMNKSVNQLRAYWAKLVFTGRGNPPQAITNTMSMLTMVANNPNAIGIVDFGIDLEEGIAKGVKIVEVY